MGLGDLSSTAQIAIGITVGIISTSIQSLGLTLQRKSHLLEDGRQRLLRRPPHRRRRWQIGMLLFLVSNILGSSIQITTLPLVILSPLQASGLVFNSICATLILTEPFTRYSLVGTILVCIGATLIATFGALKQPAHSLDELLELLGKMPFLLWMGAQAFIVSSILIATKATQVLYPRTKNTTRSKMVRGISYGCVSGILSADCLLIAKSAVELLIRTVVDRVNQFNRWQSWMILLGLVSLALTQLFYLHLGLKLCSTSVLYPLVFCIYNIIVILDGILYYQQASRLSALHSGLIALGTMILLSGVLCLSWRLQAEDTNQPAKTGSALTTGLGFVDTDSDVDRSDVDSDEYHDNVLPTAPLLRRKSDDDKRLAAMRNWRRAMSQAEEIWGELQDEEGAVSPRASRFIDGEEQEEVTDERTSLLRKPPGRRKASYGFPQASTSPLSTRRSSRSSRAQDATGGWWKLGWWDPRGRSGSSGEVSSQQDSTVVERVV